MCVCICWGCDILLTCLLVVVTQEDKGGQFFSGGREKESLMRVEWLTHRKPKGLWGRERPILWSQDHGGGATHPFNLCACVSKRLWLMVNLIIMIIIIMMESYLDSIQLTQWLPCTNVKSSQAFAHTHTLGMCVWVWPIFQSYWDQGDYLN